MTSLEDVKKKKEQACKKKKLDWKTEEYRWR